jgi:hypothetical protein
MNVSAMSADIALMGVSLRDAPHEVRAGRGWDEFACIDHALANVPKACA